MAVSVDEVEVLAQNRAFYAAFRQRDFDSMDGLWAQRAKVACVHPGWQPIRGREQVMASWRAILGQSSVPQIRCEDASAHVLGDTAFVLCEEVLGEGRLVATNVFIREEDDWRLVHHQAGPMAPSAAAEDDDEDGGEQGLTGDFLGGDMLAGLRLGRLGVPDGDDSRVASGDSDADGGSLSLDDDAELRELGDEDALAGGGLAGRSRGAGVLADSESRRRPDRSDRAELPDLGELPELDDNEAPEVFLNLALPATRRLLN